MPRPLTRDERAAIARAIRVATSYYNVWRPFIFLPTRSNLRIVTCRQVAMYLANCTGGVRIPQLRAAFGRDGATITHNIRKIEDLRDEGSAFDRELTHLEEVFLSDAEVEAAAAPEVRKSGPKKGRRAPPRSRKNRRSSQVVRPRPVA